jgi:hypothetical protein
MDPVALPPAPHLLGDLIAAAYGLLAPLLAAAIGLGAAWLRARGQTSKALHVLGQVAEIVQSVVAHVEVSMRPLVVKALEDGKLSKEEAAELKKHALDLVKDSLGTQGLEALKRALGLSGEGAVMTYLSGLVERALGIQRAAGTLPPPAPGAVAPSFPIAPSPNR